MCTCARMRKWVHMRVSVCACMHVCMCSRACACTPTQVVEKTRREHLPPPPTWVARGMSKIHQVFSFLPALSSEPLTGIPGWLSVLQAPSLSVFSAWPVDARVTSWKAAHLLRRLRGHTSEVSSKAEQPPLHHLPFPAERPRGCFKRARS